VGGHSASKVDVVFIGVARNLSWRGHTSHSSHDPWMAAVSLPSRLLGRKIEILRNFFVKNVLFGHLGRSYCPLCPSPATPMAVL